MRPKVFQLLTSVLLLAGAAWPQPALALPVPFTSSTYEAHTEIKADGSYYDYNFQSSSDPFLYSVREYLLGDPSNPELSIVAQAMVLDPTFLYAYVASVTTGNHSGWPYANMRAGFSFWGSFPALYLHYKFSLVAYSQSLEPGAAASASASIWTIIFDDTSQTKVFEHNWQVMSHDADADGIPLIDFIQDQVVQHTIPLTTGHKYWFYLDPWAVQAITMGHASAWAAGGMTEIDLQAVPAPASLMLMGSGLLALWKGSRFSGRRRKDKDFPRKVTLAVALFLALTWGMGTSAALADPIVITDSAYEAFVEVKADQVYYEFLFQSLPTPPVVAAKTLVLGDPGNPDVSVKAEGKTLNSSYLTAEATSQSQAGHYGWPYAYMRAAMNFSATSSEVRITYEYTLSAQANSPAASGAAYAYASLWSGLFDLTAQTPIWSHHPIQQASAANGAGNLTNSLSDTFDQVFVLTIGHDYNFYTGSWAVGAYSTGLADAAALAQISNLQIYYNPIPASYLLVASGLLALLGIKQSSRKR
jgi:hypothetical protein